MLTTQWQKSSWSNGNGGNNCVEARVTSSKVSSNEGPIVQVRDSKDPSGPALQFTAAEWDAFIAGMKGDEFTLPRVAFTN